SLDASAITGEDAARSTTTTFSSRAIRRARTSAVHAMLSPGAVPRMVTLRAPGPGAQISAARRSISLTGGDTSAEGAAVASRTSGSTALTTVSGTGCRTAEGSATGSSTTAGASVGASVSITTGPATGAWTGAGATASVRGVVIRSNSPVTTSPVVRSSVASVAISTIG